MKIFSGSSNLPLATEICKSLSVDLGKVYLHEFPSNEKFCQFQENIRGEDVFLIQSGSYPANDNLMELLVMSDAARRASAGRITAVLPYFFYSRQDRKEKSRVPISARLVMDMLQAAGVNRILTMDLHTPQIGGFTNMAVDHLYFQTVLAKFIKETYGDTKDVVVVAPDVGAVKRGEQFAETLNSDFAFISKKRQNDTDVSVNNFVGNVKDKTAIIIDDMTESCGTICQAAEVCREQGAIKTIGAVSHFCITKIGMRRLSHCMPFSSPEMTEEKGLLRIDSLIHSNSVNQWWSEKYKPADIIELSVGPLFAKAIYNIHNNESISDLF